MLNNGAYMHKYNAFLAQSSTQDVISMYANAHRYEFKAPKMRFILKTINIIWLYKS